MTRWDCDVKLWRGVPCSFPAFHGWPFSSFDDIVLSSTSSLRYTCCGTCYAWVPESSRYHACSLMRIPPREMPVDDSSSPEEDDADKQDVYVICTEENSESHMCTLCTDRMHLQFLQDIEEWVFMDCVEHEGIPIHKLCRDCVYGSESFIG